MNDIFRRTISWFVILSALVALPAIAAEAMSNEEIRASFAGNTLDGVWGPSKTPYKQFFDANGSTTYVEAGGRPSQGRWWTRNNTYCSSWPPSSAESCYEVRRDGDTFLWVAPGNALYPSKMLPGNQL